MTKAADITGMRCGLLTAKHRVNDPRAGAHWLCDCECGCTTILSSTTLRLGRTKSCGCLKNATKHGFAAEGKRRNPLYSVHASMVARCYNENDKHFKDYGGRGIIVCDRWRHGDGVMTGAECFIADMSPRPECHSLDRENNDGPYSPENCRWATPVEQARNSRKVMDARERGLAIEDALQKYPEMSDSEIGRMFGVSRPTVLNIRHGKYAWQRQFKERRLAA